MEKKFLTGSNAFFSCYEDFKPKDRDFVVLNDSPKGYKNFRQISTSGMCMFELRHMSADEMIEYTLKQDKTPMAICKFLCTDFVEYMGITIEQIKLLQPLVEILDKKHIYLRSIYDSYIQNGDFFLTDEQRMNAYEIYKSERM